ncbi:FAD-dependent monooxygenase [Nocardia sp. NBC_01499]|uniref:FAD-dependent monooxygenase n=1 Tax=Nocardia sp. NBC_01499 TaxID=2903597 RepID=UPI00386B1470
MTPDGRPVLVVGGGPVGLAAATELLRRGVPVQCVDKADGPSTLTKALAVWPRALELFRRVGGADEIRLHAKPFHSMNYYSEGRRVAQVGFTGRTRPVVLPQPEIESLLTGALSRAGGAVQWRTELTALDATEDGVKARLRLPNGAEVTEEFSFVIGCDGASSTVRKLMGIEFEGATYPATFVVADVGLTGAPRHDASHFYCSARGILVISGLPSGRYRVFTSAPPDLDGDSVSLELVQRLVDERGPGGVILHSPTWLSAFSVHARHAQHLRSGRVLLAGDSAHAHSPAGGQGLNTGVLDSQNLAWKIALIWHGYGNSELLDTYATERAEVARAVVRQADRQTRAWLLRKRAHVLARDVLLRAASTLRLPELIFVPALAGLRVRYRSAHGIGRRQFAGFRTGALVPDRLIKDESTGRAMTLRDALTDLRFTLLLSHDASGPEATRLVARLRARVPDLVELRTLGTDAVLRSGSPRPRHQPGRRSFVVLVRPDQHIAAVCDASHAEHIIDVLATLLRPAIGHEL